MDALLPRTMLFLGTTACALATAARAKTLRRIPPVARRAAEKVFFGVNPADPQEDRGPAPMDPPRTRTDEYYWLRDETRKDAEVLAHLAAENAFAEEATMDLQHLREELYDDMLLRLKETDDDHPYQHGDFLYYTRTVKGLSYKIHCRKPAGPGGREQIVLDENAVAAGHDYSAISCHEPSPDHTLLAYAVDHNGYETYTLRLKDIVSGRVLPDTLEETSGDAVWGADSSTLFYLKV